jgi:hypothetical protein
MRFFYSIGIVLAMGGATLQANSLAYELTGNAGFGTVDLNTGIYTSIGSQSQQLAGLGVAGGLLYGALYGGNTLYQVDTSTGAITSVGNALLNYQDFGSTLSGLYAIGADRHLYSINASTGAPTDIGDTGLALAGITIGLSTNSSTLYYTNGTNLYTLNTSTGAATLVGSTGARIGAMVFEGGSLWAGVESPLSFDTLNTTNGNATFVSSDSNGSIIYGLAPVASTAGTPEPGTWTLLATAMGALALLRRRRKAIQNQ